MLFNSLEYLFFLPIVVLVYYLLPHRFRWMLLLAASYFFYGSWKIEYLGLIIFSTAVDYSVSNFLDKTENAFSRKLALSISLVSNLGLLFFFKYHDFFLQEANNLTSNQFWDPLQLVLPVGISFYTFQTLGYTLDVYFKVNKAEKNPFKFAVFVAYFPQLVAGPIERFKRLHHQILDNHAFTYENFSNGLRMILYGFFVKMAIADNVSPLVDKVYLEAHLYTAESVIGATLLFGLQIYADFFGYSMIAIGSAQLMGVQLMDNFKAPYLATSIGDFWRRWHISLSTWFRDYLYIPLGGNKGNPFRWTVNILIVFTVSGLWHGANWTFVIWGALHGAIYLQERFFSFKLPLPSWINNGLGMLKTYLLVHLAWVFFRADSLDVALNVIRSFYGGGPNLASLSFDPFHAGLLVLFVVMELGMRGTRFDQWIGQKRIGVRWLFYAALLYAIMAMAGTVNHPFIYFQF